MDRRTALAAGTLAGALVLVALHVWRGIEYWNYSEGVYVYTSQLLLHGGDLYGHTVVAQPPWQFLFGAGALGIRSIPTVMVFRQGILLFRQAGALPGSALDEIVEKVQGLDMDEVRKQIAEHEKAHADGTCDHGHDHDHDHEH